MIYTFYSYKGGVGRSMALANVAEWFYQQGLRVLIIDWDLEAPGLENFFLSEDEIEKVRAKPGLIDILLAYKNQYPMLPMIVSPKREAMAAVGSSLSMGGVTTRVNLERTDSAVYLQNNPNTPSPSVVAGSPALNVSKGPQKLSSLDAVEVLNRHLPPLEYFLYPLRPTKDNNQGGKQALWLLSAGWRSKERFSEYGREVQNFSWAEFYDAYHGDAYFEWMRRQLNSDELADVVLIDSRTGLTEMGGVSTRQLADVVVSFTAPNVQNLSGVAAMTASFRTEKVLKARNALDPNGANRPLEVIVVPTRVETNELAERQNFKKEFTNQFTEFPASFRVLKKTFWDLMIPYISKYAYRERLAIGDELGAEELQEAYKKLAAHLVLLAPEGCKIRTNFGDELKRIFPGMLPRVLLLDSGYEDLSSLRSQLEGAGLSLWDNSPEALGDTAQPAANIDLAEFLVLPVTSDEVRSERFLRHWRSARQHGVCVQLVKGNSEASLTDQDLPLWLRDTHIYDPATELDNLIELLRRPCITSRIPFMVPELPDSRVDRPLELGKIIAALLNQPLERSRARSESQVEPQKEGLTRVAVCGPPGSGKSVLATAACIDEKVLATFNEGILWVTLGEKPDIPSRLAQLYSAVTGESSALAVSELELESMLTDKLAGKRVLLVVNDVCNESDLKPFIGIMSTGALLITTRDRSLATHFNAKRVVVKEMTSAQSLELLTKVSQISPEHDKTTLNRIVETMGHLPLPIKLAALALRQRLSLGEKSEAVVDGIYNDIKNRGVVAFDQKNSTERNDSVARSIALSVNSLSEHDRDDFLKLFVLKEQTASPVEEIARLWEVDEAKAKDLLMKFAELSLLDYDAETKTVKLNRVMESFLRAQSKDPSLLSAKIEKAENIFGILTREEQVLTQRVFSRLVRVTSPEAKLPDSRRSFDLEKFDLAMKPVIETLIKAELLTIEKGSIGGRSPVQIADDSLVQNWPRLRTWLDADRSFLIGRQTLEPKVDEWESSKRHNREVLLRGKELAAARTWLTKHKDDLDNLERRFIEESISAAARDRRNKTLISLAALAGILVLVAIIGFQQYRAWRQQQQALQALSETRIEQNTNVLVDPVDQASYRKAIEAYNQVIEENPKFAQAYTGRGSIHTSLGDYDLAVKDYQSAVELAPNYAPAWKDLGIAYRLRAERLGSRADYDAAINSFNEALSLRPDYSEALSGRGDTYLSKGDRGDKTSYDAAIADYTRVIVTLRERANADIYYKRGLAYKAKGDNSSALADFQKASELPGDDVTRENIKRNLQQLRGTEPISTAPAKPILFIQYNDPDDKDAMIQLAADLKAEGFRVVGQPQLSSGIAIGDGDVRSFNPEDFPTAEKVAAAVQKSLNATIQKTLNTQNYEQKTISARPLKDYPNVPLGQIEVWIASLRISKAPQEPEVR